METVYHYTTLVGLHGMLCKPIETDKGLSLNMWANSIYAMDDPKEYIYGYHHLTKVLINLENELGIDNDYKISSIFSNIDREEFNNALIETIFTKYCPYVISFSKNSDSLPMWIMYADKNRGACLCFENMDYHIVNPKDIPHLEVEIIHKLGASDVQYGEKENCVDSLLKKVYQSTYMQDIRKNSKKKLQFFATFINLLSPYIKTKDWEFEKEIRVVVYKEDNDNIKTRVSACGNIVHYIEVPIPIKYLKKIIIGSSSNYELAKMGITRLLKKFGNDINIEIVPAELSYQQY